MTRLDFNSIISIIANIQLGKHTIFVPPLGWLMRKLGGIPIERSRAHGVVEEVVFYGAESVEAERFGEGCKFDVPFPGLLIRQRIREILEDHE